MSGEVSGREAADKLKAAGFSIVETSKHILLIDCDTPAQKQVFESQILLAHGNDMLGVIDVTEYRSKSRGWHYVVHVYETFNIKERLMLQAMLGSDPKRELLGLYNLRQGDDLVSFLSHKGKGKKLDIMKLLKKPRR